MRRLLFCVLIAAALYAGYWVLGRVGLGKALDQIEASPQMPITYDTRRISGFPSRFDTTFTGLAVDTPELSWRTPLAQVFALAYRPTHVIAYLPGPHDLTVQGQPLRIEVADARASLRSAARPSLPLQAAILDVKAPVITTPTAEIRATRALASLTASDEDATYSAHLDLPDLVIAALTPMSLRAAAELRFDRALDKDAGTARLQAIDLSEARIESGAQSVTLSGALTFDSIGMANGTLTVTAPDWRGVLAQLQSSGAITADQHQSLGTLLGGMAQGDRLTMPLTVRNGVVIAGFIPLAQIPPLYRQ